MNVKKLGLAYQIKKMGRPEMEPGDKKPRKKGAERTPKKKPVPHTEEVWCQPISPPSPSKSKKPKKSNRRLSEPAATSAAPNFNVRVILKRCA